MTMIVTDWDQTRMGRLEALYRQGLSFSLIAADIGVTRSAAIGKARRMRLPPRPPPLVQLESSRSSARQRQPRIRSAKVIRMDAPKRPVFVPEPGRDYRCTIYDLQDRTCRYPVWDTSTPHPDRLYCGVPAASLLAGVPYCPCHMTLCGGSPPRNE